MRPWPGDDQVPDVDDAPPGTWLGLPGDQYALDADVTLYWPWVRPCWQDDRRGGQYLSG